MFGEQRDHHEMVLDMIHPTGVEEWYCPTCGQRFLLQWPPAYNKVFIEVGNQAASHSGDKMGADKDLTDMDLVESAPTPGNQPSDEVGSISEDERSLAPWIMWLKEVDFEKWWSS